jgi:GDPmannose 4,6-dehydratase
MPIALITGITGQDGSYLAELLLDKGYKVFGVARRTSSPILWRLEKILDKIEIVPGDLHDIGSIIRLIQEIQPDEIYNLAAQSFVSTSWSQPVLTAETTGMGVVRMLEAIKLSKPDTKFYQASSSEMFGKVLETPQTETTPFYPRSPYGVAKVYGHFITINYRESYGMHAVSGILFNHESPRRGIEFVTRKVTDGAARIKLEIANELRLGNLESKRDWGHAKDYVRAMWLMLQQETPKDYVIGTGETHTIRKLCEYAFGYLNLDYKDYVKKDPRFYRPAEVDLLISDPKLAREELGWVPEITFKEMVEMMVDADMERLEKAK